MSKPTLNPGDELYDASIAALKKWGGQLVRGTGEGPTVPDPTGDWTLTLPVFADYPQLTRVKDDFLEYHFLAVKEEE